MLKIQSVLGVLKQINEEASLFFDLSGNRHEINSQTVSGKHKPKPGSSSASLSCHMYWQEIYNIGKRYIVVCTLDSNSFRNNCSKKAKTIYGLGSQTVWQSIVKNASVWMFGSFTVISHLKTVERIFFINIDALKREVCTAILALSLFLFILILVPLSMLLITYPFSQSSEKCL